MGKVLGAFVGNQELEPLPVIPQCPGWEKLTWWRGAFSSPGQSARVMGTVAVEAGPPLMGGMSAPARENAVPLLAAKQRPDTLDIHAQREAWSRMLMDRSHNYYLPKGDS